MKSRIYILLLGLLSVLWMSSCIDDGYNNGGDTEGDSNVKISFQVDVPKDVSRVADENKVNGFRVFLFNINTGSLEMTKWTAESSIQLSTTAGKHRICVVANYAPMLDDNYSAIGSYNDLIALNIDASYMPDDGGAIVMYGENIQDLPATTGTTSTNVVIPVERTVAKISFTLQNVLPVNETYVIKKVTLHNLVNASWLVPHDVDKTVVSGNVVTLYDSATGMQPTSQWSSPISYLFENRAGASTSQDGDQTKKGARADVLIQQGKSPAYIQIEGIYTKPNSGGTTTVVQKVYLGHDNYSDFNVNRNENHTYTIIIKGDDDTDTRVDTNTTGVVNFISANEYCDAHYVKKAIHIKATTAWKLEVCTNVASNGTATLSPDNATGWAYVSKSKSNSGTNTDDNQNEITTVQAGGIWSYVTGYNRNVITGSAGDDIVVYLFTRENITNATRKITLKLSSTTQNVYVTRSVTQLSALWTSAGFGVERIEDSDKPFGFSINKTVVYTYHWGSGFWNWLIASLTYGWKSFLIPKDVTKVYTTDASTFVSATDGLANTKAAMKKAITAEESQLLNDAYDASATIPNDAALSAIGYCLTLNSLGDFATVDAEKTAYNNAKAATGFPIPAENVKWYLPAIGELEDIQSDDPNFPFRTDLDYWSSSAIQTTTAPFNAYSHRFWINTRNATVRTTYLHIRAARKTQ